VTAAGVPDDVARVEAQLLEPGGFFELETVEVLGAPVTTFKNRPRSLRDLLTGSLNNPDATYVVFTDGETERAITFGEHGRLVASVASALQTEYGVGPGDRVAILAANCPEWILTLWATISLGAVAVGLNGWSTGPEIRYFLDDAEPKVLVADAKRVARLEGGPPGVPLARVDEFAALESYAPDAPFPDTPIAEDDPALILYTSGTTGRPKGAVNTHRNIAAFVSLNFFSGARMLMLNPPAPGALPTCQLMTNPLFHVSGLHAGAVMLLAGGVKSVWLTGRFDGATAMRTIEEHKCTGWSFTETVLHRLVNHPDVGSYDLSSIRQVGGGGSPISPSLQARTREVFPNAATSMGIGYGQTECAALATMNFGEELLAFPMSAGRPLPTVDLEIHDAFGEPVPEGVDGEVWLRGPMVMPGYWRRPEETSDVITPDRWLRTGDIGHLDGGRLYLSSRKRDLILRGGENVYPVEIEKRIEDHPDVDECAVIGVDDPELGQAVKAIVVLHAGHSCDEASLRTWAGATLAYYKVPEQWELRAEPLPRNASGKILKDVLASGDESRFVEE
jgi:acyl-CoA synthetase (AMP-forming)/AMP-acid ligase II